MQCVTCRSYFRKTEYNDSNECMDCLDTLPITSLFEEGDEVDVQRLINPSGLTKPVFYD